MSEVGGRRSEVGDLGSLTDKVSAFITRLSGDTLEMLVFMHPPHDGSTEEPSIQVPAGTVEEGEAPRDAVLREAFEETGLRGLVLHREIGPVAAVGDGEWMVTRGIDGTHLRRGYKVRETGEDAPPDHIDVTQAAWSGAVPADALTKDSTRYLYELRLTEPAPDAWDFACDCGVPIRLYWVAVVDAVLHTEQQPWLDAARGVIGGRP